MGAGLQIRNSGDEITAKVIGPDYVRDNLPSFFSDAIILDLDFNITLVSQSVLDYLDFSHDALVGKSINDLSGDFDFKSALIAGLTQGYFENLEGYFITKCGRKISVEVSGFYLGLISDINGRVMLKITNRDAIELIQQQLEQKKIELDKFIYRTAHDIRGPLATILGLVNLLKMRQDNTEVDRLLQMLDAHALKLDERLFQLVYLAQADEVDTDPENIIHFSVLETNLRKVIEQNAFVDFLDFHVVTPSEPLEGVNEKLIDALLTNVLRYILSLPANKLDSRLFFRLTSEEHQLVVTIGCYGFVVEQTIQHAIQNQNSVYTDTLSYPRLVNFFAAQKVAWKLNGTMQLHFLSEDKQKIVITIPVKDR